MMTLKPFILIVLLFFLFSQVSYAFEDADGNVALDLSDHNFDGKTFPAYGCIAEDPADAAGLIRTDGWSLFNASAQGVVALCPLIRDNVKNLDGTVGVAINIHNTSNSGMGCTLRSHNKIGTQIANDNASTTAIGNSTLVMSVNISERWAHYSLSCDLPSGNQIISYSIAEKLRTDLNN